MYRIVYHLEGSMNVPTPPVETLEYLVDWIVLINDITEQIGCHYEEMHFDSWKRVSNFMENRIDDMVESVYDNRRKEV